jgi:hypothetical protein
MEHILANLSLIKSRILKLTVNRAIDIADNIEITIKSKEKELESITLTNITLAYEDIQYLIDLITKNTRN